MLNILYTIMLIQYVTPIYNYTMGAIYHIKLGRYIGSKTRTCTDYIHSILSGTCLPISAHPYKRYENRTHIRMIKSHMLYQLS